MKSVFKEMIKVLELAERRGVPPHLLVFSMNPRGMRRFRRAYDRTPGAGRVLDGLVVTCDPAQEAEIKLGPLPN